MDLDPPGTMPQSKLTQHSVLYANKINPTLWQDVNQVEQFGFLSMYICPVERRHGLTSLRNPGPTIPSGDS